MVLELLGKTMAMVLGMFVVMYSKMHSLVYLVATGASSHYEAVA
jgi:hypothetical protein